jgi:tRNA dimethylallyltransferase
VRESPVPGAVIAVFGPTAAGKSAVAEALAERIPAELVSADSMQVYRGLPILTNQPHAPTRLVGIWPLDREASVVDYARLAHAAIDEILGSGRTAVVVGGTGLYLRAAVADLSTPPAPPPALRERMERLYERVGGVRAHALLSERDPEAAARVHPNDRRRVVRALELVELGTSLAPGDDRLWASETRHPTLFVGLDLPEAELRRRIEERARSMFARGVESEVRQALEGRLSATARQVIGLREVAGLPREEALTAIVSRTRRYAAYQRKWLRRMPGVVILAADRPSHAIADEILEVARARERLPARRAV